jgi:NAD(P)H-dependent FMN reductase
MFEDRLRVAVIVGSVREGRFAPVVADWIVGQAKIRDDFIVDVIDLAETPFSVDGKPTSTIGSPSPRVGPFAARIGVADAFVVVTPEYNHAYPGSLKLAIDSVNREWHAKPVAFVSYGGMSGGLRAVEGLRVVFAELHAVTIRDTVSFHRAGSRFDENHQPRDASEVNAAATVMFDRLAWWARALRGAREDHPYGT